MPNRHDRPPVLRFLLIFAGGLALVLGIAALSPAEPAPAAPGARTAPSAPAAAAAVPAH